MDSQFLISFQDIVHTTSLVVMGLVLVIILISILKPQVFKKFMFELGERKYVISTCLFIGLLCGTVFLATEPNTDNTYVSENSKNTVTSVDLMPQPETAQPQQIEIKEIETVETIPYPTQKNNDPSIANGQIQLIQAGKNGQKSRVYVVTYSDGKETSRSLKSETITLEPVPEITAGGPKPVTGRPGNSSPGNSDQSQSGRGILPRIELTCKKDGGSNSSGFRICLYRN